jgi:hypothetical protein
VKSSEPAKTTTVKAPPKQTPIKRRTTPGESFDSADGRGPLPGSGRSCASGGVDDRAFIALERDVVAARLAVELHPVVRRRPPDERNAVLLRKKRIASPIT